MLEKALDNLKTGDKFTMVGFGEFGFAQVTQSTVHDIKIIEHKRYSGDIPQKAIEIMHKPKRKRTYYKKILKSSDSFALFDSWVDIPQDTFFYIESKNGMKIKSSIYTSFDKRNIDLAIQKAGKKPVYDNRLTLMN